MSFVAVLFEQENKFWSVLYPNFMHWLRQVLKKSAFLHDESAMFDLQGSIMELLTFCTEIGSFDPEKATISYDKQSIARTSTSDSSSSDFPLDDPPMVWKPELFSRSRLPQLPSSHYPFSRNAAIQRIRQVFLIIMRKPGISRLSIPSATTLHQNGVQRLCTRLLHALAVAAGTH